MMPGAHEERVQVQLPHLCLPGNWVSAAAVTGS